MTVVLAARRAGKKFYEDMRTIAQRAVAMNAFPETTSGLRVHIDPWANVQATEDGAYVEATIWVPRSALVADALVDASGRDLGTSVSGPAERPAGPWDANRREP